MEFKTIKLKDMMDYIEENAPEDKEWFKSIALETITNKKGEEVKVYRHLNARMAFCEKYMPEIIPKAKQTKKASEDLLNW